ncbi:MAG TPA: hypothetical protein VHP11_07320, partial [Tepidisphaeraceae bacterium]|nr:hypothetical protein [Tepidisphaeraceae bacterium]
WKQAQGPVHLITSYGLNGAINGYGYTPTKPVYWSKITQFKADDIAMWEQDESWNGGYYFNDGSNFPREGITNRHGGTKAGFDAGAVVSTFSGGVEWMTVREFYKLAQTNPNTRAAEGLQTRSRVWCCPKQISNDGHEHW